LSDSGGRARLGWSSLGLEEREEPGEHVAGVVVDVLVDELLGAGRVGAKQEPYVEPCSRSICLQSARERWTTMRSSSSPAIRAALRRERLTALHGGAHGGLLAPSRFSCSLR
jgi:hypothetical protein